MSSRTLSTVARTSRRLVGPSRVSIGAAKRHFVTSRPAGLAAVTASIAKTKGVEGPDVSAYPPPKHLKVPSVMTPEQIKTVSECLNARISDAFALFVKTKNYHWHVTGSHFRGIPFVLS